MEASEKTHDDEAAGAGLRVLTADEDKAALGALGVVLEGLGHEVAAFTVSVREAAQEIARADPDLAVVRVHKDEDHSLELIGEIAEYASGPVIALLDSEDRDFIAEAAERGIYAYAQPVTAETIQGAIEVAVRRQAEAGALEQKVGQLETALERRALIERAKGILMERHGIDEGEAFARLRDHARSRNRRVVDIAHSVAEGHALLPAEADGGSSD